MSITNDDIYIDLMVSNSIQNSANQRVPVQFMQSQTQPILKNTNDYKLSIIRFALNTETLPIFIPTMLNPGDTTTTIYSITMEYNGVYFQQYMAYAPQNLAPIDPDEYFYVYNYQYLIYLVNQCLIATIDVLGNMIRLPTYEAPTMSFDQNTGKCTMNINDAYFGYNESNKINIYMNLSMYQLFSSIPAMQINSTAGRDYQLNNLISQDTTMLVQEYSTIPLWNPVSSVVFTTNLLPIYQSQTPPIQVYVNGAISNNNSTFNFLNILTDFIGNDLVFVPFIQYAPAVYRYLSLKHNTEIRNIDLQVFWLNKNTGVMKPLYLGVGGSCSVKLFLTKNFN